MRNYYQILGVNNNASAEEIKSSYRKLAREYHPDVAKTADAEEKFKEINRAYETLSDSLKRADYDQFLHKETFVKTENAQDETVLDKSLITDAFLRIGTYVIFFVGIAFVLEWFSWWLGFAEVKPFTWKVFLPGIIAGALFGGFWGADANFKVETFLRTGILGRTYTFLRTICMGLALGYILSILGALIDQFFYHQASWVTFLTFALGVIFGTTIGSDGDTIEKIRNNQGRFNLFYTTLRGLEVGAITGAIGLLLGLLLLKFGLPSIFLFWSAYVAFILGDIAGSVAPANLAAYASYASAYVTSILVLLMVLGALVLGIIIGTNFGSQIHNIFSDLWQGIIKLF